MVSSADNLSLKTIAFLNQKIDAIVGKSEILTDLKKEIKDEKILKLLENKYKVLEQEISHIEQKIDLEKKYLKKSWLFNLLPASLIHEIENQTHHASFHEQNCPTVCSPFSIGSQHSVVHSLQLGGSAHQFQAIGKLHI